MTVLWSFGSVPGRNLSSLAGCDLLFAGVRRVLPSITHKFARIVTLRSFGLVRTAASGTASNLEVENRSWLVGRRHVILFCQVNNAASLLGYTGNPFLARVWRQIRLEEHVRVFHPEKVKGG